MDGPYRDLGAGFARLTGLEGARRGPSRTSHVAGLSLYHIKNVAILAETLSPSSPTSISITLDTRTLPERNLQSPTRHSLSNLRATVQTFARPTNPTRLQAYYGP